MVDREGLLVVVVVVVTPLTLSAGGRVKTETNLTVDICLQTNLSVIITFDVRVDGKPRVEDYRSGGVEDCWLLGGAQRKVREPPNICRPEH